MKDIRITQYDKIRKLYQQLIKKDGRQFSINDIIELRNEIITSTSDLPLSGKYRVDTNSPIDIKSMNVEMALVKTDIESIFEYLTDMEYKKREMDYIIQTYSNYTIDRIRKANLDIMSLSTGKIINGITTELQFQENINEKLSTAVILDDRLTMPVYAAKYNEHIYVGNEVKISRIGPDHKVEILGKIANIFNPGSNKTTVMRLYPNGKNIYSTCGFRINIAVTLKDINYIFLRMDKPSVGMNLKIETYNSNKSVIVYDKVINSDTIDVSFTKQDITSISIYITMNVPNKNINGNKYYEWVLHSCSILYSMAEQECVYITNKIPIEKEIEHLQLVRSDEASTGATIKYYISNQIDAAGIPTAFDEVLVDDIYNINLNRQKIQISPSTKEWNIPRDITKGKRLYNILECMPNTNYGDIKIFNHQISMTGLEIVQDSIRVYNGIDNYRIETRDPGIEYTSDVLVYPTTYDTVTKWIKSIPLKMNITREAIEHANYDFNNLVTYVYLNYKVSLENREHIKFYTSGNKVITTLEIVSIIDNVIVITGKLPSTYAIYIDYISQLSKMIDSSHDISLDNDSVEISVNGIVYRKNIDYIISSSDTRYHIELLKTGEYANVLDIAQDSSGTLQNDSPDVNIKYKFMLYKMNIHKMYITNIYSEKYSEIEIVPFKHSEISAGNYHIINEVDVSKKLKHEIVPGWNVIKTSQPYPSSNNILKDVNQYTKQKSQAGIIINDSFTIVRPYINSMRQVSPFVLATSNKSEKECFAYENGKIFLNYMPEFINQNLITDPVYGNITGERFLGKVAVYDIDKTNLRYDVMPEKFNIEFKYIRENEERNIYVKIEMSASSGTDSASVFQLGLNKYKGE